jgi:hypothetical protein
MHSPIMEPEGIFDCQPIRPGVCKLLDGTELRWKVETGTMAFFWNLVNDVNAYLDRFVSLNKALLPYKKLMNKQQDSLRAVLNRENYSNLGLDLDLVGIVMLAGLDTFARWTALRGTASLFDSLVVCPGSHNQQNAPDLAKGEYPACAAMTSGYVFRVENEATVFQLQRLGKPGHLTTIKVTGSPSWPASRRSEYPMQHLISAKDVIVQLSYFLAIFAGIVVWVRIAVLEDWWGLICFSVLVLARLINVIIIQRRASLGWKGALEPGVHADLLILLSQDRWIRMRGLVDDVKAVTSGQWLREPTFNESSLTSLATLLVYVDVVLWRNAQWDSQAMFLILLLASSAYMGICNHAISEFRMYDKIIAVDGEPKKYNRRLDLADELIKETGRKDWAIRLGMVQADKNKSNEDIDQGPKIM